MQFAVVLSEQFSPLIRFPLSQQFSYIRWEDVYSLIVIDVDLKWTVTSHDAHLSAASAGHLVYVDGIRDASFFTCKNAAVRWRHGDFGSRSINQSIVSFRALVTGKYYPPSRNPTWSLYSASICRFWYFSKYFNKGTHQCSPILLCEFTVASTIAPVKLCMSWCAFWKRSWS